MDYMRGILVAIVITVTFLSVVFLIWKRYAKHIIQIPAYLDNYWDILKEKRKVVRFEKRLPVTCVVEERPGNVHRVFNKNISGEGICLAVPEMLPEGSLLGLKIEVPNEEPITAKGEVVWVKEAEGIPARTERLFDTGVKFIKIELMDKIRLGNFLSTVLEEKER